MVGVTPEERLRSDPYPPRRDSRSEFVQVRKLRYHVRIWEPANPSASAGTLVMLHGWMDVSASFQFLVDCLQRDWRVIAPDWRGYGRTEWPVADCYWFPDYLADLDALLERYSPSAPATIVAHSLGGNASMLYAGVRPERVARLVNLEGTGLRGATADEAPGRYAKWLDELREPPRMRDYASLEDVAARLRRNNPRLREGQARFLAEHWSRRTAEGRYELLGDPAHKIVNPVPYRVDEVLAVWRRIQAEVLLVFSARLDDWHQFVTSPEYQRRLAVVPSLSRATVDDAGHMMHHDQPQCVAELIEEFLR